MALGNKTAGCSPRMDRRNQSLDVKRDWTIYSPVRACWGADHFCAYNQPTSA